MNLKTVNKGSTVGPLILPCQKLKFIKTTLRIVAYIKKHMYVILTLDFIDRVDSIP